jgi:hypothetical protein
MATQTVQVSRDSYGHELTPQDHAAREAKIQSLMSGGRDRFAAENIADGRPEWSQRIECTNNVTQHPVYLASKAANDSVPVRDRETLSDLETRWENINFQLREQRRKREEAQAGVQRGKRILTDVRKYLKYIEDNGDSLALESAKERCDKIVAKVEYALAQDEKLLGIAASLITRWEKELKDFPAAKLKRKQEEADLESRLKF